ncbi:hypothetical protein SDC9_155704 [bioreactor metagenome]|uniref:Uncharacterized protein n=1 Tax=bioreactor metagenome TaxID=1076179 RepID=A0A645F4H7_9ZZZZ
MRIERQRHRQRPGFRRQTNDFLQQLAMTAVDAVKNADRQRQRLRRKRPQFRRTADRQWQISHRRTQNHLLQSLQ